MKIVIFCAADDIGRRLATPRGTRERPGSTCTHSDVDFIDRRSSNDNTGAVAMLKLADGSEYSVLTAPGFVPYAVWPIAQAFAAQT